MRNLKYEFGPLEIDQLVQRLNQEGITDAKVEPRRTGYIIHLVSICAVALLRNLIFFRLNTITVLL